MITRIHRKISHPAATNNVPTIKSVPYHDTVAAFRRPCRLEAVTPSSAVAMVFDELWSHAEDRAKRLSCGV
jgi:hypothetical protein